MRLAGALIADWTRERGSSESLSSLILQALAGMPVHLPALTYVRTRVRSDLEAGESYPLPD